MNEPWWKTAIFYQIYPRSFVDSNKDGIGDLQGIIQKLDYLVELGITAIWVSPFFRSPMKDFGYDISDYREVDPIFGNSDDVQELLTEAHNRHLKVIFDLVLNHTSDQHPWFLEAKTSKDNPKHDWFIWKPCHDSKTGKKLPKPNNWVCQFEFKSAWWENPETDEWYLGTFTRYQPEVNWRNPELRKEMFNLVQFWLDQGVDGFRLDVVNWYVKDSRFRSNPFSFNANPDIFQKHVYDRNQPETHDICKELRAITDKEENEKVLVGEIFVQDPHIAASYQGDGTNELHLAFNMQMLYLKWHSKKFARALQNWYLAIPEKGWPNFTLSNHDQPRHGTRFKPGFCTRIIASILQNHSGLLTGRLQISAMLLLAIRGTPFIYYGEEIGMMNVQIPRKEMVDPTGITFWPLPLGRDGERTPMQWSTAEGCGFTQPGVKPWLRFGSVSANTTVSGQQKNPGSLWAWYQKLITIRKENAVLATGSFQFLNPGNNSVVSFRRSPSEHSSLNAEIQAARSGSIDCYLNFSIFRKKIQLPADGQVLLGNYHREREILQKGLVTLEPQEALLIRF